MNQANSTIRDAILNLDVEATLSYSIVDLSEKQIDELLLLADQAITSEIQCTASAMNQVPTGEIADYVKVHRHIILNYLNIRAILRGEATEEDEFDNFSIF